MRPNRFVWPAAILCLVVLVAAVSLVLSRRSSAPQVVAVAPTRVNRLVVHAPVQPVATGSPGFHGTVMTAAGAPAGGARVQLFPDRLASEGNSPCPEDPPDTPLLDASCGRAVIPVLLQALDSGQLEVGPLAEATADAQGRFQLPGNAGVRYRVCAAKGEELACAEERAAPAEVALPLAAARTLHVEVVSDEGINPTVALVQAAPPGVRRAAADADGRVLFEGLAPGTQVCLARAEHYRAEMRTATGFPETEQLLMRLVLLARVAGRVLDGEAPARGATVLMGRYGEEFSVVSGVDGRFEFAEVPCEWQFDVEARLGDRAGSTHVRRRDGMTDLVVRMQPSGRISIRVVGAPEGDRVQALLTSEHRTRELSQPPYVFEALPPGSYLLTVSTLERTTESLELPLGPGQQIEREVRLTRGETLSGVVVDDLGRPVPRAELMPRLVVHPEMSKGSFERLEHSGGIFRSDDSGAFEIGSLHAGLQLIRVRADCCYESEQEVQAPATGLRIALRRAASLAGQVVDVRGRPVPKARVEAFPTPTTEADCDRLMHTARPGDEQWGDCIRKEGPVPFEKRVRAVTDDSGAFALHGLDEVSYDVFARVEEFAEASLRAKPPATGLRLVLGPGGSVTVRVVDERGTPVEARSVSAERQPPLSDSDEKSFDCEEKEGAWRAEGLPAGDYRIKARVKGRPDSIAETRLAAGAHADVTVRVERGEELTGQTVDERGAPLATVTLFLALAGEADVEQRNRSGQSDDQGHFSFAGLPKRDRPAHLVAMGRQRGRENAEIDVAPGVSQVRLVLALRPRYDGRILAPDGRAPTQCSLHLVDARYMAFNMRGPTVRDRVAFRYMMELQGRAFGNTGPKVGPEGDYSLDPGAGDQRLTAVCAEGWAKAVLHAGVALAPLQLTPGATLTAHLPAGTWQLTLYQGDVSLWREDLSGTATVTGLPPGRWDLYATGKTGIATAEVELSPGGSADVTLEPQPLR